MGKYFNCIKCNNDVFSDEGIHSFTQSEIKELKCLKCGNPIFLEVNSSKFKQISIQFEGKRALKLLKK